MPPIFERHCGLTPSLLGARRRRVVTAQELAMNQQPPLITVPGYFRFRLRSQLLKNRLKSWIAAKNVNA
jgi:hypothetical protein